MGNVIELKPERSVPENDIQLYLHCRVCLSEIPENQSAGDYQQLEVGWTAAGLQVWCKRHDMNVVNIDFEGHQHPAI